MTGAASTHLVWVTPFGVAMGRNLWTAKWGGAGGAYLTAEPPERALVVETVEAIASCVCDHPLGRRVRTKGEGSL